VRSSRDDDGGKRVIDDDEINRMRRKNNSGGVRALRVGQALRYVSSADDMIDSQFR